jgi:hypothetical protein
MEPDSHLLHDLRSVHIGAHRVERDTRLRISHLGLHKCGDESSGHLPKRSALLFFADAFDSITNLGEVTPQDRLQERAFVWEVLV